MKYCWTTINVKNMDESLLFYRDFLGLEIQQRFSPAAEMEITFLGEGETKIELICTGGISEPSYNRDISLGFEVPSLEETIRRLSDFNISEFEGPIQPNPHLRFIFVLDPNGLRIQLVEKIQ